MEFRVWWRRLRRWVPGPRTVGKDLRLEHENCPLDCAAGMLHGEGHSAFKGSFNCAIRWSGYVRVYNQHSLRDPHRRIAPPPPGDRAN